MQEVQQCFANRTGRYLKDTRARHKTNPPSQWFIAETDKGRKLKIVFLIDKGNLVIKSAFEPEDAAVRIYFRNT